MKMTIPDHVREVLETLSRAGEAYLVGGCVRDALMGRTPSDFDVTTSLRPEKVMEIFPKVIPTGILHGTVTIVTRDGDPSTNVEVTTYRSDGVYTDGRRPDTITYADTFEADASRRDFSINAIGYNAVTDKMVDPFGGARDIKRRVIACVGEPLDRFNEDGLRPLRAVRFASTLRFYIEPETLEAIPKALSVYEKVATERVAVELKKILRGPKPSRGLNLLLETGLMGRIIPGLSDLGSARPFFRAIDLTPRVLRLPRLFWGRMTVMEALKLSRQELDHALQLEKMTTDWLDHKTSDAQLRRKCSEYGPQLVMEALAIQRANLQSWERLDRRAIDSNRATRDRLRSILQQGPCLKLSDLALNGNDVKDILHIDGRKLGEVLKNLLDRVIEQPSLNTPEGLREQLTQTL